MATTTEASAEEYKSEVSTMTTEASIEEAEDTTRLSEYLQRVKLYDDGGVGVFTGRPRSRRRQRRHQLINFKKRV